MLRLYYPRPTVKCLLDVSPSPAVSRTSPQSTTLRLSDTALFAPDYPPSFPVLDCLFTQASTPAGLHRPSLRVLYCRPQPAPQVPLGPSSPALQAHFCRLVPCLVAPLSPPLTSLVSLTTPVSATFYLLPSSASSLNHPPPFWPRTAALSLPVLRRFVSPVPGLLSPSLCFILTRSFASPFLGVLWWFVFFRVTF